MQFLFQARLKNSKLYPTSEDGSVFNLSPKWVVSVNKNLEDEMKLNMSLNDKE